MMYVNFTAGNKEYRLRLNTRSLIQLEKQLGKNPVAAFAEISDTNLPTVTDMVNILYCSLQQFEHGITLNAAYDIFDNYIADGHNPMEFISVIYEIFVESGLIPRQVEEEKN